MVVSSPLLHLWGVPLNYFLSWVSLEILFPFIISDIIEWRENLVWELFSIVFFLLLVFCRVEQEIANRSSQQITPSTQNKIICSHMTWTNADA